MAKRGGGAWVVVALLVGACGGEGMVEPTGGGASLPRGPGVPAISDGGRAWLAAASQLEWRVERREPGVTLNAIWGAAADDIFAVGERGTILHSTGDGRWTAYHSDESVQFSSVWGASRDDIHVVGDDSVSSSRWLHSADDGRTWQERAHAGWQGPIAPVIGRSHSDFYLGGLHTVDAGQSFHVERIAGPLLPFASSELFVAEFWFDYYMGVTKGYVERTKDEFATVEQLTDTMLLGASMFSAIAGSSPDDVFVARSSGVVLHCDGTSCHEIPTVMTSALALASAGAGAVWVAGNYGVAYQATGGGGMIAPAPPGVGLFGIWAAGPLDVYAVGEDGTIVHGRR